MVMLYYVMNSSYFESANDKIPWDGNLISICLIKYLHYPYYNMYYLQKKKNHLF